MKGRFTTDEQRTQMRRCLHSACETAQDLTPIYLCTKARKGKQRKGEPVCVFDEALARCKNYETFPERFNN